MLHGGTLTNPPSKASIEGFAKGLSQIASVADATARAALVSGLTVTAANPVWVYRQDTKDIEVTENGTTWRVYSSSSSGFRLAGGKVTLTFSGSETASAAVTFPAGRFSVAPLVVTSLSTATLGITTAATGESTAGVTIHGTANSVFTGTCQVTWLAIS